MKRNLKARPRAYGLLLAAAALPYAAFAQEAQPVTPPTETPAPAAVPEATAPAPAPSASPSITFAPAAPVVQNVPPPPQVTEPVATAEPAAAPARRATRAAVPATRTARSAPQPAAAAEPAAAPSPTATASPTSAEPVAAASPEVTPTAAPAPPPANDQMSSGAAWAMLAIPVLAILGLIAFLVTRRRRKAAELYYDEPYYETVDEVPVAAAPVEYDEQPVAAVAEADTAARPWVDIGLRPIRADDALQVELTVSNSGEAQAHDVRVSTWMLNGASTSDNEHALIEARSGAQVATVDVAPGGNQSVDTTMALPDGAGTPILVAEARYPLPDGGEGRIAATFEIDVNGTPEGVEARLHELLERA